MNTWRIGTALTDPSGGFAAATGISADGALLVRPDGFVAWRAPAQPSGFDETMRAALAGALGGT